MTDDDIEYKHLISIDSFDWREFTYIGLYGPIFAYTVYTLHKNKRHKVTSARISQNWQYKIYKWNRHRN